MVLALDASISSTGFCVVNSDTTLVEHGKLTTTKKQTEEDRIYYIVSNIKNLIEKYEVESVILESQYLGRNVKTAMQLSRLRGAIMFVVAEAKVPLIHLTPSEIRKKLMDNGSASKEEVAEYIREYYKDDNSVIALGEFNDRQCKAKNSDIYDAISIGLAHVRNN